SFLFLFTSGLCAEVLDYGNNSNLESQKNILQASKIEQDKKDIFVEQYLNDNDTDSNFFNLNNKEPLANKNSDAFYDIAGKKVLTDPKKLVFTKYQKAQINYLELERKSKLFALEKEMSLRKKTLDEELAKKFQDVFLINDISEEIKKLAVDIETVNINVDKKIRYVLDPEQYLQYKQLQNDKTKNNK
ncbi:MAG: hypothetical protein II669_04345, partial [Elusimicrobia bacterium]|nr:hypothetical protein [Elusimicrobiota bacterium]